MPSLTVFIFFFQLLATKGTSANLMKVGSKRPRGRQQIEEEKRAEEAKQEETRAQLAEL